MARSLFNAVRSDWELEAGDWGLAERAAFVIDANVRFIMPAIFVAILILFIGLVTANFLSRAALLAAVNAGYPSPKLMSWSIRFVIWALAVSMALEQVGVARQTVIAAFSIVFGAFMFGLAIAFGLGGRELAREFLERNLGEKKTEKYEEPQPL